MQNKIKIITIDKNGAQKTTYEDPIKKERVLSLKEAEEIIKKKQKPKET